VNIGRLLSVNVRHLQHEFVHHSHSAIFCANKLFFGDRSLRIILGSLFIINHIVV
jgi:hypothetical protein